ncbi:auxin efflux carrier [Punctularia strigosozonata HHB-11173 SS5]|uniref:auxin efflux carrier n=1 Tax=Punctularia strigosozonata (strain HHB-11173) TaxID=741275 RepID=UPI0004418604|nr:auxin efflux carrier [Punctularia strigosozonata HHB-11173 SS5]EIN08921.1 auxin efflux carrier [Punctularia strigosozonata HHB-11173 SS5]
MLSAGALIWVSLRPLIRLVLATSFGFAITKADIFPAVAARGAGQIMLNIALPCLMFSKIVPAFTTQNISALGPLVLVAIIYQALGVAFAWAIKQVFWVPHRFRYGILVAGGFGNTGDIPTAVVMSIAGNAPFNGTEDQNLAVAYIAAFILVFFVLLFPAGGHRLIAWDYIGPDVEDEEVREATRINRRNLFLAPLSSLRKRVRSTPEKTPEPATDDDVEKGVQQPQSTSQKLASGAAPECPPFHRSATSKHVSFFDDEPDVEGTTVFARSPATTLHATSRVTSPAPTVTHIDGDDQPGPSGNSTKSPPVPALSTPAPPPPPRRRHPLLRHSQTFLKSLLTPSSISIILAFIIALVNPLKALFVTVDGWTGTRIPNAPDGQPPLAFVMDTASFVGAASVPLGLTCLGSALARLKIPSGEWKNLPLGAISSLAVARMILIPVIGVIMCQGLATAGVIDPNDKVLRFVCIFLACLPTATTQVFLTQVYSGTGDASVLSAFLIPQYAIMVVSMTALTAYTITLIF